MEDKTKSELFSGDVSPALVLLDVQGRKNPVLCAERAMTAICIADNLQNIGGTGRGVSYYSLISQGAAVPNKGSTVETVEDPGAAVLLYYRSFTGRPRKSEIARVAKAIAKSNLRNVDCQGAEDPIYVTGSRAVVYPERLGSDADAVPFLCSTTVWYNSNRCVTGWPASNDQITLFLEDINSRLDEGEISIAR